jgi:hypothetical protein
MLKQQDCLGGRNGMMSWVKAFYGILKYGGIGLVSMVVLRFQQDTEAPLLEFLLRISSNGFLQPFLMIMSCQK